MIVLALLPSLFIQEVPIKDDVDAISVLIRAPENLSAREQFCWHILAGSLLEGNQEYTRNSIFQVGGQAGIVPQVTSSDQLISIRLVLPKGGFESGSALLKAMLLKPVVNESLVKEITKRVTGKTDDDIWPIIRGFLGDPERISAGDVGKLWQRAFRPENITFCTTPGGAATVRASFADWQTRPDRPERMQSKSQVFLGPQTAHVLGLADSTLVPGQDAPRLLCWFALGVGKESSAHRIIRNQLGLTYRQELLLVPKREGWQPTFLFAGSQPLDQSLLVAALKKDAETWDSSTLLRAKSMLQASFLSGLPVSPVWVTPSGPYQASEIERLAFMNFTRRTPEEITEDAEKVELPEIKKEALEVLDRLIPCPQNPHI